MATNDSITEQMNKILDRCSVEVSETIESTFDSVAQKTVKQLKQVSPKKTGAYAKSWTRTKTGKRSRGKLIGNIDVTVYNRNHYRLTHLLEKGHVVRNQFGSPTRPGAQTRVAAQPHIAETEEWAKNLLVGELERKL